MTNPSLQPAYKHSLAALLVLLLATSAGAALPFEIVPAEVQLKGNFAQTQLLVREASGDNERSADLTHKVKYESTNASVVTVVAPGRLLAVGDGQCVVKVQWQGKTQEVPVSVSGVRAEPKVSFHEDVLPILSKAGCNAGECHASQYGKGGFKLSVFAFDPGQDYEAIVRDRSGRRVDWLQPEHSLVLRKPTLDLPHGGSRRLEAGSTGYQIIKAWLDGGAPPPSKESAKVTKLEVIPKRRLGKPGLHQQLRVLATYSDARVRDVTSWAQYDSMDEAVASVSPQGKVTAGGRGQAPIMIRFRGQAEIALFVIPYQDSIELADWKSNNFVDEIAAKKFRELGLEPSPLCDDATFVRRAYLDAIGTLPTLEEVKAFLDDSRPDKRQRLVDRLLGLTGDPKLDIYGNAWSAYWALKWSDLIRSSSDNLGDQGMWALYNWIRGAFRENTSFDKFVTELITAQGSVYMNGPANYYRIATRPDDLAETTAQLFLGIRLQCAKCHHHPFESYGQEDYYGLAAFFARVGTKNSQEFGLFGREQVVLVKPSGEVRHPRTNKNLKPTPLGGEPVEDPLDRRRPLAKWLTSKDNKYFAYNVVNRYMSYLMGSGLVEPVDDLRATNPPSNPELMDALAEHFRKHDYDIKQLVRVIMNSRLYQLSSQPTPENAADSRFYSHYLVKRIAAEPLLDAIDRSTGTQTKFPNLPLGTRAIELPDANYQNYFLTAFGKPRRVITCECERVSDPNLTQTLHVLNGSMVSQKVADKNGRVAKLLAAKKPHEAIVAELYLSTLSRRPKEKELQVSKQLLQKSSSPKEFYEDLLWALLNSKEFLFVR